MKKVDCNNCKFIGYYKTGFDEYQPNITTLYCKKGKYNNSIEYGGLIRCKDYIDNQYNIDMSEKSSNENILF